MDYQSLYHLLVVDDDRRLRGLLEKYLSDNNFLISTAANAEEARTLLLSEDIDLIILDIMMPKETGLEFMQKLRSSSDHPYQRIPILVLTALSDSEQRIKGLELGADDYLTKPFEPKELLLRIRRILQRLQSNPRKIIQHIAIGRYQYDLKRKTLIQGDNIIVLSSAEQKLLEILIKSPGVELPREELAAHIGVPLSPRTVDVQITRLRRRIEDDPKQPRYIRTVRNKGYIFYSG